MRPEPVAGGTSASRVYRASTRLATTWMRWYTHGVEPNAAADRVVSVELELWEHALVADRRWSAVRAAVSLVAQTVAGMPSDLSWRRAIRTEWTSEAPPVHLLVRRHRQRFWVPLRAGHVFDQTNGMAGREYP